MRIILLVDLFSIIKFINENAARGVTVIPKGIAIIVIQYTITGALIAIALCVVQVILIKKDLGHNVEQNYEYQAIAPQGESLPDRISRVTFAAFTGMLFFDCVNWIIIESNVYDFLSDEWK